MSSIAFHGQDETAHVRGPERAMAGILCADLLIASWGGMSGADRWLLPLLPADHYLRCDFKPDSAMLWAKHGGLTGEDGLVLPNGERVDVFTLQLNTAKKLGNDVVKFLAHLHGQCEVHGYVEGPNREWLAQIIEAGRAAELLREDMGWEDVIALLRKSDAGPVVTSYSVCESFPGPALVSPDDLDDDGWEKFEANWYDTPSQEQWRLGVSALREQGGGLEWSPTAWEALVFGGGHDGFSVRRIGSELGRAPDMPLKRTKLA